MFTESKQWLLVGLTSNGIGCARAAYAGIYTRVAAYKDWVRTYTNDSSWIVIDPGSPAANTGSTSTAHSFCFIVFIFLVAFC
jgi:secreted trypsin-like serine protease